MPTIPHWSDADADNSWDALILAGNFVPGVPKVKVKRPVTKLDKQKSKGQAKSKTKDTGPDSASLTITITLITRDDLAAMDQIMPLLAPAKPGAAVRPIEIQHPAPNIVGITSIVIENVDVDTPTAKGGLILTITASEWTPEPAKAQGLGGLAGSGAESCAGIGARASAATSERMSLQAAQADAITALGQLQSNDQLISTSELHEAKQRVNETSAALENAKAKEGALYGALNGKCKTATPPSKDAQENVAA